MTKLWIARDKNDELFLYNSKPVRIKEYNSFGADVLNNYDFDVLMYKNEIEINPSLFPKVTWENSPQQVELKLIKNDSNS